METAGIALMSNDELMRQYERSILDLSWLEKMRYSCNPDSPAYKHYDHWMEKEERRVDALAAAIEKRKILV